MGILEKLGLAPKKKQGAPVIGEKKKKQEEASSFKYNPYLRAFILVLFLGIIVLAIPESSYKEPINYNIGEPWRADDLTAPFTFAIQKSDQELEKERQTIRETTPPIFHKQPDVQIEVQSKLDSLFQSFGPLKKGYETWQQSKQDEESDAQRDSLRFEELKNRAPINLSDSVWQTILENYESVTPQNNSSNAGTNNQFSEVNLKDQLETLADEVLENGVLNVPKSELSNDEITIRDLQDRTEQTLNLVNVRDLPEAKEYAQYRLSRNFYDELAKAGSEIFAQIIQPNYIFNKEETQARIQDALDQISTSKGAVAQGQVIIRRGDIVTPEKYNMLQSLADARAQKASTLERWLRYGGNIIAVVSILTIFFFYLYLYRRYIFINNSMLTLVLIAFSLVIVSSGIVYHFEDISPFIVPIAIAPIILTIIFDSRVGLLSTITLALLTGLINGNNFEFVTATTVACSLGLFSVRDIKKRSQFFFTTPGIVFGSYLVVVLGFSMTTFDSWSVLGSELLFIAINAIFILFTYPLILLFEKSFNVTTDFSLLELSDTNLPLLKTLMTKAPGTFHHSLQVSNLAEAAAGAIRANGLLCRVGGLYHDIGKMDNPEYFIENQTEGNVHDKLKPRMSALVIKAHVSNGVKIAEEHGLPDIIIDFIKTHHGDSLIKFFWEKAKEQADTSKKEIKEKDFRYDGPLPQTKETGILLLADGVEAASRAMKDPNYQKLENLIDKMIDDRVNEGQLSKTPLTFQDIRAIKETFLNILVGIYHSRVEYPDDEKEQEKKASEKTENIDLEETPATDEMPDHPDSPKKPPRVDEYYNS
ncbi:HDIG domain-containing metalloprotein [Fodinibius sp.]|uniref:HD family phosphohydrolase n=1 Tax=Fodinibius sp. TaxID=1872440 RepID=UPI002ACD7452|nr:HDIG domain-containing metalloprotein [Fodinibius sp.]MDZ7657895.1 HDIG domain-containing protein [Fodinibius sp.]